MTKKELITEILINIDNQQSTIWLSVCKLDRDYTYPRHVMLAIFVRKSIDPLIGFIRNN